ncbi:hypothetical protein D3C87_411640 [compost metagenome]
MKISPRIKLVIVVVVGGALVSLAMGLIMGFDDFFALPGVVMAVVLYKTGIKNIDKTQEKKIE